MIAAKSPVLIKPPPLTLSCLKSKAIINLMTIPTKKAPTKFLKKNHTGLSTTIFLPPKKIKEKGLLPFPFTLVLLIVL